MEDKSPTMRQKMTVSTNFVFERIKIFIMQNIKAILRTRTFF